MIVSHLLLILHKKYSFISLFEAWNVSCLLHACEQLNKFYIGKLFLKSCAFNNNHKELVMCHNKLRWKLIPQCGITINTMKCYADKWRHVDKGKNLFALNSQVILISTLLSLLLSLIWHQTSLKTFDKEIPGSKHELIMKFIKIAARR
jgi:hypothetical protein